MLNMGDKRGTHIAQMIIKKCSLIFDILGMEAIPCNFSFWSDKIMLWINSFGVQLINHRPNSPHMGPSDYYLFPKFICFQTSSINHRRHVGVFWIVFKNLLSTRSINW